jgi:holo-[acyl-carrier protein] synthase
MQATMLSLQVGTDVVAISRIAAVHARFGARFVQRLLHPSESTGQTFTSAQLARRWAAKEAVAKALGTGIGQAIGFQHIIIAHTPQGAPLACCTAPVAQGWQVQVSVADDPIANTAVAFAIARRGAGQRETGE